MVLTMFLVLGLFLAKSIWLQLLVRSTLTTFIYDILLFSNFDGEGLDHVFVLVHDLDDPK